jgi:hypothetical protein
MSGMETRRWTNPHQPQTLQIAVFLLYASAVLEVIFPGGVYAGLANRVPVGAILWFACIAALAAGAFGIANEKRWGYNLAVGVTGLGVIELVLVLGTEGIGEIFSPTFWLYALFPVARFALLVHPQSREHQRVWFS